MESTRKLKVLGMFGPRPVTRDLGWLGINILNPALKDDGVELLFHYLNDNFTNPLIILEDHLYRYNIMIFYNVEEDRAVRMIRPSTEEYLTFLKHTLAEENLSDKIQIKRWKEVFEELGAEKIFKYLQGKYHINREFRIDINNAAKAFIYNQIDDKREAEKNYLYSHVSNKNNPSRDFIRLNEFGAIPKSKKILRNAVNFLLEEIAFNERLNVHGYKSRLDSEALPSIYKSLREEKYNDVAINFDQMHFVQVKINVN
jgi:hypothetical protein